FDIHGDAREVAGFLPQSRELVEYGGFAAVRVAYQSDPQCVVGVHFSGSIR
ncbi:MAG: hypothetical protein RL742_1912, partial [Bacteroidota bacterium]